MLEVLSNIIDNDSLTNISANKIEILNSIVFLSFSVLSVKSMWNKLFSIYWIKNPVSIIFESCSENNDLIELTQLRQEFIDAWSHHIKHFIIFILIIFFSLKILRLLKLTSAKWIKVSSRSKTRVYSGTF
jgi:hypothetical protein